MKKITIGLFTDSFFPMMDGVCMVVDNYAKRLSNYANVIVFAPRFKGKEFDDSKFNYRVIRCASAKLPALDYSLPLPKLDKDFIKELNKCNLDIVHIHSPFTLGKIGIEYAKKNDIPVIATMHSQFKKDIKRAIKLDGFSSFVNKKLIIKQFDRCDECWAVNKAVADLFYDDYKCKTLPRVMDNATGMEPLKDSEELIERINKKHKLNDEKVFLFVGRLNKLKNIDFIVNSLKIFKEKYPDLKFKMLFVGDGQDKEQLKSLIKQTKLNKEIVLCGKITDRKLLAAYYLRADLFLFPSLYDASSIVQIEAASQSTPTLFLEGAATSATVEDNVTGFTAKNSEEEYASRIYEIINDKKLYNKVCKNLYKDLYVNWDDKIKEVYKLYLDKINTRKIEEKKI